MALLWLTCYAAQAQLSLNHPNEALTSALQAYDICQRLPKEASNAFHISSYVVKCKKEKWDLRESERLRRRNALLAELEDYLRKFKEQEFEAIDERVRSGELGPVGAHEEKTAVEEQLRSKTGDLQATFAAADPSNLAKRVTTIYMKSAKLRLTSHRTFRSTLLILSPLNSSTIQYSLVPVTLTSAPQLSSISSAILSTR